MNTRTNNISNYHQEKIELLKRQCAQKDKELEMQKIQTDVIIELKNIMKKYLSSISEK